MNRLSTSTLTVLTLLVPTLLPGLILAQAPTDNANFEVGNQVLISSHDRIEIQEKLLYGYAYAFDSKDCVSWANLFSAPTRGPFGGVADSLDEAKAAFRAAWERTVADRPHGQSCKS